MFEGSQFGKRQTKAPPAAGIPSNQPIYVVVFGYPSDKFSATAEYFQGIGDSTEADPNTDISNCFRIGYSNPADAMRAVRKNGEILSGQWMVGAKWAVSITLSFGSQLFDSLQ